MPILINRTDGRMDGKPDPNCRKTYFLKWKREKRQHKKKIFEIWREKNLNARLTDKVS